jgi:hypothetical protein
MVTYVRAVSATMVCLVVTNRHGKGGCRPRSAVSLLLHDHCTVLIKQNRHLAACWRELCRAPAEEAQSTFGTSRERKLPSKERPPQRLLQQVIQGRCTVTTNNRM